MSPIAFGFRRSAPVESMLTDSIVPTCCTWMWGAAPDVSSLTLDSSRWLRYPQGIVVRQVVPLLNHPRELVARAVEARIKPRWARDYETNTASGTNIPTIQFGMSTTSVIFRSPASEQRM